MCVRWPDDAPDPAGADQKIKRKKHHTHSGSLGCGRRCIPCCMKTITSLPAIFWIDPPPAPRHSPPLRQRPHPAILHEPASETCFRQQPAARTDSYKASHWLQYPPGTEHAFSYIESRGEHLQSQPVLWLAGLFAQYLSTPITLADVAEAKAIYAAHGEPFNKRAGRAWWKNTVACCPCAFALCPKAWCCLCAMCCSR